MYQSKSIHDITTEKSDAALLKSKLSERFYELGIKRKLLEENRCAVARLDLEKHGLTQRAERAERELSEARIHLQVAIKAAREAEAERSTARELLARQGAQLEAAAGEREYLQQTNRTLQLEVEEKKRELEDNRAKMKSHCHFMELIKKKDSQNKVTLEILTSEVEKLTKSQSKVKELCLTVTQITKVVNNLLQQQKLELSKLIEEKSTLQKEVAKLTGQLDEINSGKSKSLGEELNENRNVSMEWERCQHEIQQRVSERETEIMQLQKSLDAALDMTTKLQASETEAAKKIRGLEEELGKTKEHVPVIRDDKNTQTEAVPKEDKEVLTDDKNIEMEESTKN